MKYTLLTLLTLSVLFSCQNDTGKTDVTGEFQGFRKATSTGINFKNTINETPEYNYHTYEYMYNGGGVAIGDVNNDGLEDIYFTGNQVADKLYLNKGNLEFEDVTEKSGINKQEGWHTGVTMVDLNADGWLDIFVCKSGKTNKPGELANLFYENNGNGTFTEKAALYGLASADHSIQSVFFDMDNDGDLDVFTANHPVGMSQTNSAQIAELLKSAKSPSDRLYRNDGGKFTDITQVAGIYNFAYTLGISIADYNRDGYPDIFISADFEEPDRLYFNQKNGTFKSMEQISLRHISNFGMGCDAADINNDGWADLFNLDMAFDDPVRSKTNMPSMSPKRFADRVKIGYHYQYMHNSLHINQGSGVFAEIAHMAGVAKTDWSWAALFADFDHDLQKDLFITNGFKRDVMNNDFQTYLRDTGKKATIEDILKNSITSVRPNFIFKNNGNLTFTDKSKAWGLGEAVNSNGAAYSDLDNDGDLDLVVNHMEAISTVYENMGTAGNYLKIALKGNAQNKQAIGAVVEIHSNGNYQQYHQQPVRGYQSSSSPLIHVGLGNARQADTIKVYWPGGATSMLTNVKANKTIEIDAGKTMSLPIPVAKSKIIFSKLSSIAADKIRHEEKEYNDFEKEVLLPHKQSQLGPALAVADINGDGLEDFYVGGAAGQSGQLYVQKAGQPFQLSPQNWSVDKGAEDVGALFFDADGDGDQDLYVASGSNEFPSKDKRYQDRLYINNQGKFNKSNALPNMSTSTKAIATADVDGDGDQDIFVGGRLLPERYPNAADSYLLINDKGKFSIANEEQAPDFNQLGMVTDAQFSDIDGDQDQDLLITGEWMPVTVFKNDAGKFENATASYGLDKTNGWWWSLTASDLDGDGDDDYLLGNLGKNSKFKATTDKPFFVYANDFDNSGNQDIVLTFEDKKGTMRPVRGRECSSEQMPFIQEKFPDFQSYAEASIFDIHSADKLETAIKYPAYTFESAILWNDAGKLRLETLPIPAQTAPIQDAVIDDFDKDGDLDILAVGNMFHTEVETTRYDAGTGYFLRNNGKGEFSYVPNMEHGFFTRGNVKQLKALKIGNARGLLVGNNNNVLQAYLVK